MDEVLNILNSLSLDVATSEEKKNAPHGCQHFSIRGYVAGVRENDPKACNPFGDKNYQKWNEQLKVPIDVPHFKSWRCINCVRELVASRTPDLSEQQEAFQRLNAQLATLQLCDAVEHRAPGDAEGEGCKALMEIINLDDDSDYKGEVEKTLLKGKGPTKDVEGDGSKAPIEVINLDDSDNEEEGSEYPIEVINLDDSDNEGDILDNSALEELATLAILLDEKESAGESVTFNTRSLLRTTSENRPSKQEFVKPKGRENAKRPNPFSQNPEPISRKHSKPIGESSRARQGKQ